MNKYFDSNKNYYVTCSASITFLLLNDSKNEHYFLQLHTEIFNLQNRVSHNISLYREVFEIHLRMFSRQIFLYKSRFKFFVACCHDCIQSLKYEVIHNKNLIFQSVAILVKRNPYLNQF